MRQRIGIYRLKRATVFTRHYECAAWYTDITVQPGDYVILAEVDDRGVVKDFPGPYCKLPGIITGSAFPSLFCGNRIPGTDSNVNKDVGKEDEYGWSIYGHAMAHAILKRMAGETYPEWSKDYYNSFEYILDEGFAATYVNFEYDGKPCQTAYLVKTAVYQGPIILEKMKEEVCQF